LLGQGLPVIRMDLMAVASKNDIGKAINRYIESKTFLEGDFQKGWNKLFWGYHRQKILETAGREKDILVKKNQEQQYYQAFHYTVRDAGTTRNVNAGDEKADSSYTLDTDWVLRTPLRSEEEEAWLGTWKDGGEAKQNLLAWERQY
jgi:hypothetical protein